MIINDKIQIASKCICYFYRCKYTKKYIYAVKNSRKLTAYNILIHLTARPKSRQSLALVVV